MSAITKIGAERNARILLDLVNQPGNDVCADCKARAPRWASHNLGIFICVHCASVHRKIGTHVTKVKSITLDSWTKEQVEVMKAKGNIASNAYYNPNEARHPPPTNMEDSERDSELEKYIRAKYEYKKFVDRSGKSSATLKTNSSGDGARAGSSASAILRPLSTPAEPTKPPVNTVSKSPALPSTVEQKPAAPPVVQPPPRQPTAPPAFSANPVPSAVPMAPVAPMAPMTPMAPMGPMFTAAPPVQSPPPVPQIPTGPVWNDMMSLQTPQLPMLTGAQPTSTFLPQTTPFSALSPPSLPSTLMNRSPASRSISLPTLTPSTNMSTPLASQMTGATNPFGGFQQQSMGTMNPMPTSNFQMMMSPTGMQQPTQPFGNFQATQPGANNPFLQNAATGGVFGAQAPPIQQQQQQQPFGATQFQPSFSQFGSTSMPTFGSQQQQQQFVPQPFGGGQFSVQQQPQQFQTQQPFQAQTMPMNGQFGWQGGWAAS